LFKRRKPESPMGNEPATPSLGQDGATEGLLAGDAMSDPFRRPARLADPGLGVPPYRPAPSKEVPVMGRTPFSAPNSGGPAIPGPAPGGPAPGIATLPRPGMQAGGVQPARARDPAERRTLVVGRGISVQGTVADAERLVVEGTVEASMIHATELSIAPGGVFKGEVEVEDAEIAGVIDGTLTARGNLIVRASGKVLGTARCRRLQVEDGGQITGRIEMLTEGASKPDAPRPADAPA